MGKKDVPPLPEPKNKLFFSFGPEEASFFSSPLYKRWSENSPEEFKRLLPNADPNKPEPEETTPLEEHNFFSSMKRHMSHNKKEDQPVEPQPYHMSYGDNGSWFLIWDNGEHDENLRGTYPSLLHWMQENQASLTDGSLNVTLGPAGAFFAWCTSSCRWDNVPAAFTAEVQKMLFADGWKRRPRRVQFGVHETYIIICDDGTWYPSANLAEHYEGLTELLTSSGRMKTLSLNPYAPDNYFLVSETGNVHWKVPQTWDPIVEDVSSTYMTGHRVRTGSAAIPMDKDLTYSKGAKKGGKEKPAVDPGTLTKWLSGANTALQVGQLVVSADPSQCQHQ